MTDRVSSRQHEAIQAISAKGGVGWRDLRHIAHPWTIGSLHRRGLIESANDPHRDEVWFVTDEGRAILQSRLAA